MNKESVFHVECIRLMHMGGTDFCIALSVWCYNQAFRPSEIHIVQTVVDRYCLDTLQHYVKTA